jgi:hypothetical protein
MIDKYFGFRLYNFKNLLTLDVNNEMNIGVDKNKIKELMRE